jgi:outer membrane lipoprotein-sorting protein
MRSIPASRLVLVLAGCVAFVAVIAATYLLAGRDDEGAAALPSYHFVASLAIEERTRGDEKPFDRIEGWYEPGKGLRWDLAYDDPSLSDRGSRLFRNPQGITFYDGKTNTYTTTELPEVDDRYPGSGFGVSILLGPLPAASVDEFFSAWMGATWKRTGAERVLGLDVDVIEVTGATGGTSTFWIDPKRNFVVRYRTEEVVQSIDARMQSLEVGINIDDEVFRFVPPADAEAVSPTGSSSGSMSSGTIGNSTVPTQEGFLAVPYVPAGYITLGSGSSQQAGDRVTSTRVSLGVDKEATLFIEQQYRAGGGLPAMPAAAEAVIVNGHDGFRTQANGEERLVWSDGDIIVTIRSTTLPFGELMRIAEAMHLP